MLKNYYLQQYLRDKRTTQISESHVRFIENTWYVLIGKQNISMKNYFGDNFFIDCPVFFIQNAFESSP